MYELDEGAVETSYYRPFVKRLLYFSRQLNEMVYQVPQLFGKDAGANRAFCFSAEDRSAFGVIAFDTLPNKDIFMPSAAQVLAFDRFEAGQRYDNITDWALKQFRGYYRAAVLGQDSETVDLSSRTRSGIHGLRVKPAMTIKAPAMTVDASAMTVEATAKSRPITKQAIFHYCYAVLHDPMYRDKYAQNLKREFPRIPLYPDFWQWAAWSEALMQLHIGYETVAPFALTRTDVPDEKARAAGMPPKAMLRGDVATGSIALDSETTLRGVPAAAWRYKLGNRSALEWVLDQYKEKKPKDPTIREKFDTYRFCDYKDKVIDLLARVATVSVETLRITDAMAKAER